jgi:hypothetical protein
MKHSRTMHIRLNKLGWFFKCLIRSALFEICALRLIIIETGQMWMLILISRNLTFWNNQKLYLSCSPVWALKSFSGAVFFETQIKFSMIRYAFSRGFRIWFRILFSCSIKLWIHLFILDYNWSIFSSNKSLIINSSFKFFLGQFLYLVHFTTLYVICVHFMIWTFVSK